MNDEWEWWFENAWFGPMANRCDECPALATWIRITWKDPERTFLGSAEKVEHACDEHAGMESPRWEPPGQRFVMIENIP